MSILYNSEVEMVSFESTICLYFIPWPASQAVWVKLVNVEDMDGTFNAQVMELTGDVQEQEIIL